MIPNRADYFGGDVEADTIPGLEMAALDEARAIYGPVARLQLADLSRIHVAPTSHRPRYTAHAFVHCLNLSQVRDAQLDQAAETFATTVATYLAATADGEEIPAGGPREEVPRG